MFYGSDMDTYKVKFSAAMEGFQNFGQMHFPVSPVDDSEISPGSFGGCPSP